MLLAATIGSLSVNTPGVYEPSHTISIQQKEPKINDKAKDGKMPAAAKVSAKSKPKLKEERRIFNVTAYSLPGTTASGERVQQGRTIACSRDIPFGTEIHIPSLRHTYVCTDRGSAIVSGHLDIYYNSKKAALLFGRQYLEAIVKFK